MLTLSLAAQLVCFLGVLFYAVRRTIRARDSFDGILSGGLRLYGLTVGLVFLFSLYIPFLLVSHGADKHAVIHSFPEETGIGAVLLVGWFPALVFAALVRGIYNAGRWTRSTLRWHPKCGKRIL